MATIISHDKKRQYLFKALSVLLILPILLILVMPVRTYSFGLEDIPIIGNIFKPESNPLKNAKDSGNTGNVDIAKEAVDTIGFVIDFANAPTDTILDGACSWLERQFDGASLEFSGFILENFGPDLSYFFEHTTDPAIWDNLRIVGGTIAFGIFVISLIMVLLSTARVVDIRDTPFSLIFRLVFSYLLIMFSANIATAMMNLGALFYDRLISSKYQTDAVNFGKLLYPSELVQHILGGASVFAPIIVIILSLILGITMIKCILSVFVEVIQRYIIACFLAVLFPVAAGTLVSRNTAGVFSKYIQSYLTSILLLIINGVSVRFVLILMSGLGDLTDQDKGTELLVELIFVYAVIKATNRIDEYLYMMGLSVAATGGNLLDSVSQSFRGIVNTMSQLTRGAQNMASGAGGAMKHVGLKTGNAGLAKAGMAIGSVANPVRNLSNGTFGAGNAALAKEAARMGVPFSKLGINDWTSDLSAMVRNGQGAVLNSADDAFKKSGVGKMYDLSGMPKGMKMSDINFDSKGNVNGTLQFKDQNGRIVTQPFSITSSKMSPNATPLSMSNGEMSYLDTKPALKPGQSIAYEKGKGLSVAEIATGMNFDAMGLKTNGLADRITSVRGLEGGGYDLIGDGRAIGTMSKDGKLTLSAAGYNNAMGKTYGISGLVGNVDFDSGLMTNANSQISGLYDKDMGRLSTGNQEYHVDKLDDGSYSISNITDPGNILGNISANGDVSLNTASAFLDEAGNLYYDGQELGTDGKTNVLINDSGNDYDMGLVMGDDGFYISGNNGEIVGKLNSDYSITDESTGETIGNFEMDGQDISKVTMNDGETYSNGGEAIREKGEDGKYSGNIVGNVKNIDGEDYYTIYGNTAGTVQEYDKLSDADRHYEPEELTAQQFLSFNSDCRDVSFIKDVEDGSVIAHGITHEGKDVYRRVYLTAGISDQLINSHPYERVVGHFGNFTVSDISGSDRDSGYKSMIDHYKNIATKVSEKVAKISNRRKVNDG